MKLRQIPPAAIAVIVALLSCKPGAKNYQLHEKRTASFEYYTYPVIGSIGTVMDADNELVYFTDVATLKRVSFFTLNGRLKYSIPLDGYNQHERYIEAMEVISPDSVYLYGHGSDTMYLINKTGNIVAAKQMVLFEHHYDAEGAANNIIYDGHGGAILNMRPLDNSLPDTVKSLESMVTVQGEQLREAPYLAIVSDFWGAHSTVSYRLHHLYSRFIPAGHHILESPTFLLVKNSAIISSEYTDSIYSYNYETDRIEHVCSIRADSFKVGLPSSDLTNFLKVSKKDAVKGKGYITATYYDQYRNLYYACVLHPSQAATRLRAWSIIALDEDFRQVGEFQIPADKYFPARLLITKEGIMLNRLHTTGNPGLQAFMVFTVESK